MVSSESNRRTQGVDERRLADGLGDVLESDCEERRQKQQQGQPTLAVTACGLRCERACAA